MIEVVQNHTPHVMVIDEIGRAQEVAAAKTTKQRGPCDATPLVLDIDQLTEGGGRATAEFLAVERLQGLHAWGFGVPLARRRRSAALCRLIAAHPFSPSARPVSKRDVVAWIDDKWIPLNWKNIAVTRNVFVFDALCSAMGS